MTDENKPAVFRWRDKRLSNVSYGRSMPADVSKTVPAATKDKWEQEVEIDKTKQTLAVDKKAETDQFLTTEKTETQHAGRRMERRQLDERAASGKKNVFAQGASKIENPITKLEKHKNINKVVIGSEIGAMGGTMEDFDRIGVSESILGKKAGKEKPSKRERSENYLDRRSITPHGKASDKDKIK
jgi:hypothetical protein